MDEDPIFYKKFGELIDEAIKAFIERRISEADYLKQMLQARSEFISGSFNGVPDQLQGNPEARAFYGIIKDVLSQEFSDSKLEITNEKLAQTGIELSEIIQQLVIRDWTKNEDIQKQMKNALEDYLLDHRKEFGVELSFTQLDLILDKVMGVAKNVF